MPKETISVAEFARRTSLSVTTVKKYVDYPTGSPLKIKATKKLNGHYAISIDEMHRWRRVREAA